MTSTVPAPPPPHDRDRLSAGRVALIVVGAFAAVIGFGLLVGGAVLGWAHATQRDDDGFYRSGSHRVETTTAAITSQRIDLGADVREGDWVPFDDVGTAQVVARGPAGAELFVGIGASDDVARYLEGVAHDEIEDIAARPFEVDYRRVDGGEAAGPPAEQGFWVASSAGPGARDLRWEVEAGDWSVVLMNADAAPGVEADVAVGIDTGLLLALGIGLAVAGLLLLGVGALLLVLGLRHVAAWDEAVPAARAGDEPSVPADAYPVRLDARLEPTELSRWLWLLKWVLVIPHVVVLLFLWVAAVVLTVVAGVAILLTGRYPRAIFDFNVGVMRWTWRVGFYSFAAFGTDRYPPFRLQPDPDYPAELAVEHPDHLNRWLVLVKWWLLAIPHLVIIAIFAGGWNAGTDDRWRLGGGGGLIAVVALIAVVIHAVRGRYPRELFHFVMGLNRWVFRVWAYVWLMRDEYPPFRFDGGGTDPGSKPVPVPPPPQPATPRDTTEPVRVGHVSDGPPADDR